MTALHSAVESSRGSRRPERGQAVHAREVARVRELPGQADRRVEPARELVVERHARLRPPPQEAQAARVEVVGQRAEALRPQRRVRAQAARRGEDPSVDAAHPVDRDVLDEQVLFDEVLLDLGNLFDLGLDDRIRHGSLPSMVSPRRNVPAGFGLRLTARMDGDTLLGGEPFQLVRLKPESAARIRAWEAGEPVGDGGALARAW